MATQSLPHDPEAVQESPRRTEAESIVALDHEPDVGAVEVNTACSLTTAQRVLDTQEGLLSKFHRPLGRDSGFQEPTTLGDVE